MEVPIHLHDPFAGLAQLPWHQKTARQSSSHGETLAEAVRGAIWIVPVDAVRKAVCFPWTPDKKIFEVSSSFNPSKKTN